MAQFPMGGFFNRPRQNFPHSGQFQQYPQMPGHRGMMGNMQRPMSLPPDFRPGNPDPGNQNYFPQQNVPRGTFPLANMPHPQMTPMRQMPPQQQMPPMHLLNPTNDPNVRFEPVPGRMIPPGANPEQMPPAGPTLVDAADIIIKLGSLAQGESNSIVFYENMAKTSGIAKRESELVTELLGNKGQQMEIVKELYRNLTNSEWAASKDMKVEETRNFRADISYALLQESRLLREASQIYANLNDGAHQKAMNSVLYNKVADIAHLLAL
jgi:hypothetical protein